MMPLFCSSGAFKNGGGGEAIMGTRTAFIALVVWRCIRRWLSQTVKTQGEIHVDW